MKSKLLFSALLCSSVVTFTGCASIIHGPSQEVDFSSQPSGAKIFIDGKEIGVTPQTVSLRRKGRNKGEGGNKKQYDVKIDLAGYHPYEIKIKRDMDGWFIGNLVFGGLIGIIIDAANGSMYKLNPNQIIAQPTKLTAITDPDGSTLYVAVTLHADSRLEKIGELTPIAPTNK